MRNKSISYEKDKGMAWNEKETLGCGLKSHTSSARGHRRGRRDGVTTIEIDIVDVTVLKSLVVLDLCCNECLCGFLLFWITHSCMYKMEMRDKEKKKVFSI